ncbi:MAG: nucleoside 2-deoxyribosyltransferase [bacterium]|nr:nucleoside 2-deoxyribosyltransferase [bacterium]
MKIYFAGSIRGGRDDADIYLHLVDELAKHGEVLTEHVATVGEEDLSDDDIFARDLGWLISCDVIVAEVTTPSLGVGWEIGVAQERGVPVLCLFRSGQSRRLSAMLSGNPGVTAVGYTDVQEAAVVIDRFLEAL